MGCYVGSVNSSFKSYLVECYGEKVIVDNVTEVKCKHLIHGFTYQKELIPQHEYYYYISSEKYPTEHYSETEQFLNVVKGLYPNGESENRLTYLKSNYSEKVKAIEVENKVIIYPGGSSINSTRRWPYFEELAQKIGSENCIIIGGNDDLNFGKSYVYSKAISKLPQGILNRRQFWEKNKTMGLLSKWAHHKLDQAPNAYFNQFTWAELVALFSKAKKYIGNDGGLSHLAGACGTKGVVLFGPTSAKKNRPLNKHFKILQTNQQCSPCQYANGGIQMTIGYINCPYQISCLSTITTDQVIKELNG